MKNKKHYISLKILIPLIYSGISLLGLVLACQLSANFYRNNPTGNFNYAGLFLLIGLLTFLISLFMINLFLRPIEKFLKKTKDLPAMQNILPENPAKIIDDISRIEKAFDNVANILSYVESKELFPQIIATSPEMRQIFTQITKVAPTDSTVLISGESGTGKELVAQSIYEHSLRKNKPFIKVNCVAIPEGLLESEFFGHEKGAFTGAVAQKKGKFELAHGGTIFLDEIGDMPLATQAKILRVLQEKEFERVGGSHTISVDVRIIAATNKDLSDLIKKGAFREDLYFRLNVFSITLPPLRERIEDIPLLANYFLAQQDKQVALSPDVLKMFMGYKWPGNVRELRNVLEQAAVLTDKDLIEPQHLPENIRAKYLILSGHLDNGNKKINLDERLLIMERELIIEALKASGGVQVKAASLLGINQRSLWHRVKKLNIDIEELKQLQ